MSGLRKILGKVGKPIVKSSDKGEDLAAFGETCLACLLRLASFTIPLKTTASSSFSWCSAFHSQKIVGRFTTAEGMKWSMID
jgi:hypothetical protein